MGAATAAAARAAAAAATAATASSAWPKNTLPEDSRRLLECETELDLKSEGNHEKDITENTFNKNTQLLIYSLRRIIFARIKKGLFLKYKEDTMVKELEEIKIYHFKPNCKVEVLTLKEKLVNYK